MIESIRQQQERLRLPLIILSGRPETMKCATLRSLAAAGLEFEDLILRPRQLRMQRTTRFKVEAVKSRDYSPRLVIDDDVEILAAFAADFPHAELWLVRGDQTTPWPD